LPGFFEETANQLADKQGMEVEGLYFS